MIKEKLIGLFDKAEIVGFPARWGVSLGYRFQGSEVIGFMTEVGQLLRAVLFSAYKHRGQRRKDEDASPYINHPIEVAELMANVGGVGDLPTLMAAILHDTVEDTGSTFSELEEAFGHDVRLLVEEVTDDKRLPKDERKRLQIAHAQQLSERAKQIKIADKICNVRDVTYNPPPKWPLERRREYLQWAAKVVEGCRGSNANLERRFDEVLQEGRLKLGGSGEMEDIHNHIS